MTRIRQTIVVTGMGAVSCLGHSVAVMWDALVRGHCGIRPLTRLDPHHHRIKHAGEVPALPDDLAPGHDPATRFVTAAAVEALDQARLSPGPRRSAGLVLGSNFGAMTATEAFLDHIREPDHPAAAQAIAAPGRIAARELALRGVQSALSLSCASGNAAVGYAADLIRSGQADLILAGAYDAISEIVWAGLCSLRAMTADTLRPFDRRRDGTIFSEGAAVLVLEREDHALARGARPLAQVLGCGTSSNAFHMTRPDPDGAGMARAMAAALRDAEIGPEKIDHINAHATGTPSNDRLETAAVKAVFGARAKRIPVSGIKSMLGHAMGAAAALEAVATIMTIRTGIIPPTIALEEPDPECDLDYVPLEARRAPVRNALNNAAGFGGCNAAVVFGRWEDRK